ncbi:MAG: beta-lactamase family protein, partial [Ekhidna sp.]|nr:beta-lactamase family protein [Ekhidna sp.]
MKRTLTILALMYGVVCQGQLRKLYEREAWYGHFNGVVQVVSDDSVLIEECFGMECGTLQEGVNTRFDIGSITKQFTAAAILRLVQDEKLGLRDEIYPLLGTHASDKWKKVTVHQLLTHTSGIPSLYQTEQGLDIFFPEEYAIAVSDLIGRFREGKLLFSPAEEFSYSNSGYILLAAIIENVSSKKYEDYMNEMFNEFGLKSTSFDRDENSAKPMYGY